MPWPLDDDVGNTSAAGSMKTAVKATTAINHRMHRTVSRKSAPMARRVQPTLVENTPRSSSTARRFHAPICFGVSYAGTPPAGSPEDDHLGVNLALTPTEIVQRFAISYLRKKKKHAVRFYLPRCEPLNPFSPTKIPSNSCNGICI